jgi:undecaprenyl-diphosphatase
VLQALDVQTFYWINGWQLGPLSPVLVFFSIALGELWFRIALAALVIYLLVRNWRTRMTLLGAILASGLGNEITDWLKAWFAGPRPYHVLPDVISRVGEAGPQSLATASAHSANMTAVATAFWLFLGWKWGLPWVLIAFFTGLSRIYVGAHFPAQVLLGWAVGVGAGFFVYFILELIRKWWLGRKKPAGETETAT